MAACPVPGYRLSITIRANSTLSLCRDVVEVLQAEDLSALNIQPDSAPIAFHPPCTLQHAQKLPGRVETLLTNAGFTLVPVANTHLCCGSAGTYSLLQPELATQLRDNKLHSLLDKNPTRIATANIGCLYHLQGGTDIPVVPWIELLDGTP